MTWAYKLSSEVQSRIRDLGFDPQKLSREKVLNCDLCEVREHQQTISWIDRYGFLERFCLCENCGLIFLNPRPTQEGYKEFYEKWYRPLIAAFSGKDASPQALLTQQSEYALYVRRFLQIWGGGRVGMRLIDIGGSTGVVSKVLREDGYLPLVLDPSPKELDVAKSFGLETENGVIETWDPLGRRYDLALVCQTADHFLSIRKGLQKIREVLNFGGVLYLDIVDFESRLRNHKEYRGFLKLGHCFYLSDTLMRAYFESTGFEVIFSDISQKHLVYLAKRIDEIKPLKTMTDYAKEVSALLRGCLMTPDGPKSSLRGVAGFLLRLKQKSCRAIQL